MIINIKVSVKKLLKEKYNIDPELTDQMFNSGILKEHICRDVLIINEYKQKAQPKEKQKLRSQLAEKYCLSIKSIEKITCGLFL
jgi:hypothetical protein